jgi:hypothetical protein
LPDVPEGFGQLLRRLHRGQARGFRLDEGRARRVQELGDRGARLLQDCGTPLFFRYLERSRIAVTIGSLDDPARAGAPERQYGVESRLPAFAGLAALPETTTEAMLPPEWAAKLAARKGPGRG